MGARKYAYFLGVAESLAQCQLLELQLKFHVGTAISLKEKKPSAPVPFKMTAATVKKAKARHLKKAALGELIGYFEKLSDAPALVAELRKFTKRRNRLAHGLLAAVIDLDGELVHGRADELTGEVEMTKETAMRLNDEVHAASIPWIAHLYFDDIEDEKPAK
jgi:hypothetical protein